MNKKGYQIIIINRDTNEEIYRNYSSKFFEGCFSAIGEAISNMFNIINNNK